MSLYELGVKVFEERIFIGRPKLVIKNAIHHDGRFHLNERLRACITCGMENIIALIRFVVVGGEI